MIENTAMEWPGFGPCISQITETVAQCLNNTGSVAVPKSGALFMATDLNFLEIGFLRNLLI